jgi:uncharacterized protein (DUF736 family)
MANIGTFTAEKDGFTGTLRTLTLNVKVKLVPNDKGDNENAPDFRLQAAGHEVGAAWKKTSEAGREYLSVSIDDPSFPATVYARLIEERGRHARPDLVAQQAEGGLTAAYRVPPTAAGRDAADRSTARAGFAAAACWIRPSRRHCMVPCGSQSVSTSGVWRVGAVSAAGLSGRPMPPMASRPFGFNPHAFAPGGAARSACGHSDAQGASRSFSTA